MIWQTSDLAWFTALAVAMAMRETPIIGVIDGGKSKQESTNGKESKAA